MLAERIGMACQYRHTASAPSGSRICSLSAEAPDTPR